MAWRLRPSSRRRVDGVEVDATIQHERAVNFWFLRRSTTDLSKTIDNMKKWNARRKLKGGIKAVMASNRVAAAARGGQ
jgi:hypothetical protein